MLTRDVELPLDSPRDLLKDKHITFLQSFAKNKDGFEQVMTEYLKMSGIYWSLVAVSVISTPDDLCDRQELLQFIRSCQDMETGGIRPAENHDAHLLYTLSAIQILCMLDALEEDVVDKEKIVTFIVSLQQPDGSFAGDKWGEIDIRFSMCAVASLRLLNRLDAIDKESAVNFILKCHNVIDAGFGSRPGSESHAGLIYCAIASLSILGRLDLVDSEELAWWLAERQCPGSGGLNGRPEKLPDLCYSWWVLSSLKILGKTQWIDEKKLIKFILASQDSESGGFSDRPGNMVDPFHTCFGLTGLSLLTQDSPDYNSDPMISELGKQLKHVNPVFCMPQHVISRMGITVQLLD